VKSVFLIMFEETCLKLIRFDIWEDIGSSKGWKDCPSLPVRFVILESRTSSSRLSALSDDSEFKSFKSDGWLRVGDCVLFFLLFRVHPWWGEQSLLPESRFTDTVSSDAEFESLSTVLVLATAGYLDRPLRDLVCSEFCCCPVSLEVDALFSSMQHEAVHSDFVAEAAFHLPCIPVNGVHINKYTILR
jgi:hypothetical protein